MTVSVLTKESLNALKFEILDAMTEALDSKPEEEKKWLTTAEFQKVFDISAGSLQLLRVNGSLKYEKIYGRIYYDYEYMVNLLEEKSGGSKKKRKS